MSEQRPWHRLFALSWVDFFRGLPVTVEPEKDLSVKKQLLDVLVIRKETATLDCRLPDGFDGLATYNLITFKSHQEKLSAWTLKELIGHYVNLRKQVSPSMDEDDLLPEEQFQLYAVSSRYPQQLAGKNSVLKPVTEGVYEVPILASRIRIIVANQLPQQEHNAMLHLFSTRVELLAYGVQHCRIRSWETSTLLLGLYQTFQQEGQIMPDMLEDFARETVDRLLKELPVEKRLQGLTLEQIIEGLKKLPVENRLEGVPAETIERFLKGLPVKKRLEGLTAEQLLEGLKELPPETLRALAEKLKANGASAKPE